MNRPTKRDKSDKTTFATLLDDAFRWAAKNGKLKTGRHESAFAEICGSSVKNVRRWLSSTIPKRGSWETAKNGLSNIGLDPARLTALNCAWMEGGPSTPLSVPVASERATRPFEIVSLNPFPKLCSVNLEMPEQGTSWDDFIVIGELRFARAPDVVDNQPVTVGVRRAVLLPVCTNCYVKPGSLHRPSRPGAVDSDGAAQAVFRVNEDDSTAVLAWL